MKVCALLENQWFNNPGRMQRILAQQYVGNRSDFIHTFLFFPSMRGVCLTGRRIQAAFGDRWTNDGAITWEEISPQMAGSPSEKFPPDVDHVRAFLARERPDVVITFGKPAREVTERLLFEARSNTLTWQEETCQTVQMEKGFIHLAAPHPAARHATVCDELAYIAKRLNALAAAWVAV